MRFHQPTCLTKITQSIPLVSFQSTLASLLAMLAYCTSSEHNFDIVHVYLQTLNTSLLLTAAILLTAPYIRPILSSHLKSSILCFRSSVSNLCQFISRRHFARRKPSVQPYLPTQFCFGFISCSQHFIFCSTFFCVSKFSLCRLIFFCCRFLNL